MNALAEKYGDKVAILGYPCNQFGHQTNEDNAEFLNTLKYVRPGGNFEPAPTITILGLDMGPTSERFEAAVSDCPSRKLSDIPMLRML